MQHHFPQGAFLSGSGYDGSPFPMHTPRCPVSPALSLPILTPKSSFVGMLAHLPTEAAMPSSGDAPHHHHHTRASHDPGQAILSMSSHPEGGHGPSGEVEPGAEV